jgi:hypothetical protein
MGGRLRGLWTAGSAAAAGTAFLRELRGADVVELAAFFALGTALRFFFEVFGDSAGITMVTTWPDVSGGALLSVVTGPTSVTAPSGGPAVVVATDTSGGVPAKTTIGAAPRIARHSATTKRAGQCIGRIIRQATSSCKNARECETPRTTSHSGRRNAGSHPAATSFNRSAARR